MVIDKNLEVAAGVTQVLEAETQTFPGLRGSLSFLRPDHPLSIF